MRAVGRCKEHRIHLSTAVQRIWLHIHRSYSKHDGSGLETGLLHFRVQPSNPSLRTDLIWPPTIPTTTIDLSTILASVETKGAPALALAILGTAFAAVSCALL